MKSHRFSFYIIKTKKMKTILYIPLLLLVGSIKLYAQLPEFDVSSLELTSNSPIFDAEGNMLFIDGYPLTAKSTIQNSGGTASNFNSGLFVTAFNSPSIFDSEFKTIPSIGANASYRQENSFFLPSNTYRLQALVNTDAIRLDANGRHTFTPSEAVITINVGNQISEVNPFDNLKLQTFLVYSCSGINLNIQNNNGNFSIGETSIPAINISQYPVLVAENISVTNQNINNGKKLELKGNKITLSPGFKALTGSIFKAISTSCAGNNKTSTGNTLVLSDMDIQSNFDQDHTLISISEVTVYPNPFNNKITIGGIEKPDKLVLYNVLGAIQKVPFIKTSQDEIVMDTSHIPSGIYLLKIIKQDGTNITKKLMK